MGRTYQEPILQNKGLIRVLSDVADCVNGCYI